MEKLCDFCKVNFVRTNNIVNQISKIWQKIWKLRSLTA